MRFCYCLLFYVCHLGRCWFRISYRALNGVNKLHNLPVPHGCQWLLFHNFISFCSVFSSHFTFYVCSVSIFISFRIDSISLTIYLVWKSFECLGEKARVSHFDGFVADCEPKLEWQTEMRALINIVCFSILPQLQFFRFSSSLFFFVIFCCCFGLMIFRLHLLSIFIPFCIPIDFISVFCNSWLLIASRFFCILLSFSIFLFFSDVNIIIYILYSCLSYTFSSDAKRTRIIPHCLFFSAHLLCWWEFSCSFCQCHRFASLSFDSLLSSWYISYFHFQRER